MIVVAWMFVAIMIAVVGISTVPLPIMFVIFIAPIAIGVPALIVFIPPFMIRSPTLLAGFRQVVAGAIGLRAAITVVLDSVMQLMVGSRNTLLAILVVGAEAGGCA